MLMQGEEAAGLSGAEQVGSGTGSFTGTSGAFLEAEAWGSGWPEGAVGEGWGGHMEGRGTFGNASPGSVSMTISASGLGRSCCLGCRRLYMSIEA